MVLSQPGALSITLLVEGAVAALVARRLGAARLRAAAAAVGGSLVTHPFVWLGVLALYETLGGFTVPIFEAAAVAAEAIGYRLIAARSWRSALLLSVIANAASWSVGFVLQRFVWP